MLSISEQIESIAREDHPLAWDRMSDEIKERERAFYRRLLEDAERGLIADPRNIDNSGMSEG